jgi:hypothetical protein
MLLFAIEHARHQSVHGERRAGAALPLARRRADSRERTLVVDLINHHPKHIALAAVDQATQRSTPWS